MLFLTEAARALGRSVRAFVKDGRASVAPVSVFVVIGAVGLSAITIDGNTVRNTRLKLAAAADASALAGVKAVAMGYGPSTAAIALAERNLPPADYGNVLPPPNVELGTWNPATGAFVPGGANPGAVRVTMEMSAANGNPLPLSLASVLGLTSADVTASAVATTMLKPLCVLALDPYGLGIRLEQNNDVFASHCTIWSNARHTESIAVMSSIGQFDTGVARPCAAGKYYGDPADFSAPPYEDCAEKADPLASHPLPSAGGCLETNVIVKPNESRVFTPGTYCKGITIKPNAEENGRSITFLPGVYVFKGGNLHINNNNEISGDDVLFHFTEGSGFIAESDVEMRLTGRTSGTYAGLVITQDKENPGTFDIRSNTDFFLDGVVYLPASTLTLGADTHVATASPWIALIVKDLQMIANADVTFNVDQDVSSVPYPPVLTQMFTTLVR